MSDQAVANEIQRILERGRAASTGAAADGLCNDCGERIGAERLAALPSSGRVGAGPDRHLTAQAAQFSPRYFFVWRGVSGI